MSAKLRVVSCIIFLSALMAGCHRKSEKVTASGMKYVMYQENPGPKAKQGDFVTVDIVYKTENDSVLFDSGKNKQPMRFQLEKPPFAGSMQEGITYMASGDSATFFVSADSMVRRVFSRMSGPGYVRPDFLKTGSFLKFDVKLLRIQSELDASVEIFHDLDERALLEKTDIEKYIQEHNISQQPDSNGIYLIINSEGKGLPVGSGKKVTVRYTGKFLNGKAYDPGDNTGRLYTFVAGNEEVIRGWEIAIRKLKQGDKATLIVPSNLAYGEEGLRNKMNGTYVIQPITPLLFEIEVVEVK